MERKDDKSFKRDIIALISFPILFVSTSFLINIGKEMSLPGVCRLQLVCGRPTLAHSSALVPQTLSCLVCVEDS